MNIFILGARKGSLGDTIKNVIARETDHEAFTAGVSGDEHFSLLGYSPAEWVRERQPQHIICTIGVNEPFDLTRSTTDDLDYMMGTNLYLPLEHLLAWVNEPVQLGGFGQFVAVSSNSAHIARSGSLSYCASKAALSMAMRVAARDVAKDRDLYGPRYLYTYEPCWIEDTPMSREVEDRLSGNLAHKVPGGKGLSRLGLASLIVSNLDHAHSLHGASLRIDLGDQ